MAHFAELNEDNIVVSVLVVSNDVLLNDNGEEQESLGVSLLNNLYGHSRWKQCSYNSNFRARYPGIGSEYLPEINVFAESIPYPSWTLNRSTGLCEAPVAEPDYNSTTHFIFWDEENLQWITRPNFPEHNAETHYLEWNEETEQWNIVEIPPEPTTTEQT